MPLISPQPMSIDVALQPRARTEVASSHPAVRLAEPFVKWAGGKQSLVAQLAPHFPSTYSRYFEPFVGGGAVFFATSPARAVINDQNDWLIDTYQEIRRDWRAVADVLASLPNSRLDFLAIRAMAPETLTKPVRAAHFIYLNKTCFRGLFRVNQQGRFNVPYGAYDRRYFDPANLEAVSIALRKAEILAGDFEAAVATAKSGDFVYFDPPYYKLGGHSDFNRYTAGQFREHDHVRLAALCEELTLRGVRWALSNSDTPFVLSLYDRYRHITIEARREINLASQNRRVRELLVFNY